MRLKVLTAQAGAGLATHELLEVHCGPGQQILRWLAHAACAQLSYRRGEALGRYVPQAVLSKDGCVLDVDLVLAEVAADGDELTVEWSDGPLAFRTRWEGRPADPPLLWGADDSDGPTSPSAWLEQLDLAAEGLAALRDADPPPAQPPAAAAAAAAATPTAGEAAPAPAEGAVAAADAGRPAPAAPHPATAAAAAAVPGPAAADTALSDLGQVRSVLLQHAGALQMLFLLFACDAATPIDAINRMSLPQFKALLQAAKVTSSLQPPDRMDELFTAVQASPGAMSRKGPAGQGGAGGLDFADFIVALVHVAHIRFVAESFATGASATPLSTKLLSLLQDCIFAHLFPDLQRRLDKFRGAATPAALALLKKGRRLTEQVVERCQIRRVRSRGPLQVDVRYVAKHLLQRWGVLGKDFKLPELVPAIIFAKQPSTDPYRFVMQPQPLALSYDEFERLLLGLAAAQARLRKRGPDAHQQMQQGGQQQQQQQQHPGSGGGCEAALGELLDAVYSRAGVLLPAAAGAGAVQHGSVAGGGSSGSGSGA